ncbi:MAG: 16S rRNA (guanine(527)-N(7))-methyltransferase RsmG [candidate division WWE3 bacterium]|nr:16S rRNA (guanine(527)-N(7))-methyltransferase RsmG [candidate division WWE3 bacterium]
MLNKLTTSQQDKFFTYKQLLIAWNQKFNLTAVTDPAEIDRKHFEDSLSFATAIKECGLNINQPLKILDIGSGAGFPGIPLNIVYPYLKVTLVESVGKKCLFLNEIVKRLNLVNVDVVNARSEDLVKDERYWGTFDIATARAVAPLERLVSPNLFLLNKNGWLITQKGLSEVEVVDAFTKANPNLNVVTLPQETKIFVMIAKQPASSSR